MVLEPIQSSYSMTHHQMIRFKYHEKELHIYIPLNDFLQGKLSWSEQVFFSIPWRNHFDKPSTLYNTITVFTIELQYKMNPSHSGSHPLDVTCTNFIGRPETLTNCVGNQNVSKSAWEGYTLRISYPCSIWTRNSSFLLKTEVIQIPTRFLFALFCREPSLSSPLI